MMTDYYIPPHPLLQPFVDTYILSTSHEEKVAFTGQWPASHETSIVFSLADKPVHLHNEKESSFWNTNHSIIGLQTEPNGTVQFSGQYHTFIIQLKAHGFRTLFRLPAQELKDKIFSTTDIAGPKADKLYDQLGNANSVEQMAVFADGLLLPFLRRHTDSSGVQDGITSIVNCFCQRAHLFSVHQFASKVNMSIRNFERRFAEHVGIPPKMYIKLVRFNKAMSMKLAAPDNNWTAVAHACGYFDQMHFIKDFRQFTGLTPKQFFKNHGNMPPFESVFVLRATP
jgi:AraC-like DNA-binding protein